MIPEELRNHSVFASLSGFEDTFIQSASVENGDAVVVVKASDILIVCRTLKEKHGFVRLSGVTAVDWFPADPRFELVYFLHSIDRKSDRLRIKCWVGDDSPAVESVMPVWQGANWYEREVYDLFGIVFHNHPDLRRIMMPDGWEGHPLRRDFPVYGNKYTYKDE